MSKLEKSNFAKSLLLFATMLGTSMVIGDGVLTPCISGLHIHFLFVKIVLAKPCMWCICSSITSSYIDQCLSLCSLIMYLTSELIKKKKITSLPCSIYVMTVLSAVGGLQEATSKITDGKQPFNTLSIQSSYKLESEF